ncbi:MAG TPA: M3 family oligoendopeptidase [Bacteroidia bacterium]|nr:M3 family oligoendopeptidase [Bacteroidia bacterium]
MEPVAGVETQPVRTFLPADLSFSSWKELEPFFRDLAERSITDVASLMTWLKDASELDSVFDEELAWRYIRSTCDTANAQYEEAYEFFISEIEPNAAPWFHAINRKLDECPFRSELDPGIFSVYLRSVHNDVAIFREKNIPLFTAIDQLKQQYGKIAGDMTVTIDGKELTIQQASVFLKDPERKKREEAFLKIWERRLADKEKLDELFDQLTALRQQVAANADFENFRDYSFASLGRFDYTKEDCFRFHEAIEKEIVPFLASIEEKRKQKLGVDTLRPWDMDVDVSGLAPLKPFRGGNELLDKTMRCLSAVRPAYSAFISTMRQKKHFDLDSRKGKAPGGYNYSLAETGVPFIFMNSAGTQTDVVTMLHEAGHAIHSFLEHPLPLNALKSPPSEVCELASMSMELISMEHWDAFYPDAAELKRARREQLEKILSTLPWVASVDAFQHWIYEHKGHTPEERGRAWEKIMLRFGSPVIDWSGHQNIRFNNWQKQLHIFEVPFYYIEYGMAQLGAIAVWRNYLENPARALDAYESALKLGYTKPIGKLYEAAGIRFDFSREYVRELVTFVREQLEKIN